MKRIIKEAKKKEDEELGGKLSRDFIENRKLYHRMVKKIRGGEKSQCARVRDVEGNLLVKQEEVETRWKEYFEELMNHSDNRRANITCWGMMNGGGRIEEQTDISKKELSV